MLSCTGEAKSRNNTTYLPLYFFVISIFRYTSIRSELVWIVCSCLTELWNKSFLSQITACIHAPQPKHLHTCIQLRTTHSCIFTFRTNTHSPLCITPWDAEGRCYSLVFCSDKWAGSLQQVTATVQSLWELSHSGTDIPATAFGIYFFRKR